jgi:hypothetical protein
VGALYKTLAANGTLIDNGDGTSVQADRVTISTSWAALDGEAQFKKLVEDGTLSLTFATEAGDSAAIGHPGTLEAFADAASLPDPASRPLFTTVWQSDANLAVWTDGTDWRVAAGTVTV